MIVRATNRYAILFRSIHKTHSFCLQALSGFWYTIFILLCMAIVALLCILRKVLRNRDCGKGVFPETEIRLLIVERCTEVSPTSLS